MKNSNQLPEKKKNQATDASMDQQNKKTEAMIKKMKLQNDALEKILQTLNSAPAPDNPESDTDES